MPITIESIDSGDFSGKSSTYELLSWFFEEHIIAQVVADAWALEDLLAGWLEFARTHAEEHGVVIDDDWIKNYERITVSARTGVAFTVVCGSTPGSGFSLATVSFLAEA